MPSPDHDPDSLRRRFEPSIRAELEELDRLASATEEDRAPIALDQQSFGRVSRIDAMQGQALAQASGIRRNARSAALRAALQRLVEGEFGYCTDCGEPIALKRLAVDPAASRCISCAQMDER